MSLEALKEAAARLDDQSRKELLTFLVSLSETRRSERARRLSQIRDDQDSSRWLSREEFETRLNEIPEPRDRGAE